MKILGFSAITYVGAFWKESLLSIEPFVDKMYISYSRKPSHGHNTTLENPDTEYQIRKVAEEIMGSKLIWESFNGFHSEQDHRNTRYRHAAGYSLILISDPDEILEETWAQAALNYAYDHEERFYGTRQFIHFWKSFEWCFPTDGDFPIRIENLTRDNLLINSLCPLVVFHTSMMQPENLLHFKFSCYGHKNEIKLNYIQEKFLSWAPEKIDEITHLHPTRNDIWIKPKPYKGYLPDNFKNYKPKMKEKLRLLFCPLDYHRHEKNPELFTDTINTFNEVIECQIYNGDLQEMILFKPDVVLFQGSATVYELTQIKETTNAFIIMFTGDCRTSPSQSLMDYKNIIDCYMLPFTGELLKIYQTLLGKPCHFLFESIQNWRFKPAKMMESGHVTFVGNIYGSLPGAQPRKDLVDFIEASGIDIKCFGNGFDKGEYPYDRVPELYNNSYIVIAENNYSDIEDYFTPRNIGALSAGSCCLMKHFPGIEKFFQNIQHCYYYKNKYELLDLINFLKNNPSYRNETASNGFGLATTNFDMKAWVSEFLNIINKNYIK